LIDSGKFSTFSLIAIAAAPWGLDAKRIARIDFDAANTR
jgi:hypothetical protein